MIYETSVMNTGDLYVRSLLDGFYELTDGDTVYLTMHDDEFDYGACNDTSWEYSRARLSQMIVRYENIGE